MEEIAKSVIVRADDRGHLIEYIFHLSYQRELGAGTVEVVVRVGNMEIMVALQIVGQETDTAFQCHELSTPSKTLFFSCVHGGTSSGKIAFGKHFIQMQVKVDFALVRFILGAVVGTGADGITEIISRKTQHHGVEVNDTDAFASGFIKQNIIDFGIIMGDTQRDLTSGQLIQQNVAVLFPCMDKSNLRRNGFGSTQCIGCKSFFKVCVTVGRIVKTGNGFVEGRSRIIGQLVLELAQCFCHSAEVCLTADLLQTDGILYKIIGSPGIAFRINVSFYLSCRFAGAGRCPCRT